MSAGLKALTAFVEVRLDRLSAEIDNRFEAALQAQLDEWAKRWPRHRFEGWQGHGMLSIEVEPAVGGQSHVDRIPGWFRRGAIAALVAEAEEFVSAHAALEWKVSTGDFESIYSKSLRD